jgi:anthranilate/para-aminobenzoate synthase component I
MHLQESFIIYKDWLNVLGVKMFSKDILNEIQKDGGITKKKSQAEINQENVDQKVSKILEQNKYIEDAINRIKDQIQKGKEYKFVLNRDADGLIKEVIAVPTGKIL